MLFGRPQWQPEATNTSVVAIGKAGPGRPSHRDGASKILETSQMLWTIAFILMVMWLLGMVTTYTLNGFIHLLLVLAIITVLIRVIRGERPVL